MPISVFEMHVPDTQDRYYVLQFVDAWTNNFAYIGRRATGTSEAEFLLTDRDHQGEVPAGMTAVQAPTGVFTIVGRVQVDGEADLPAVHALQDQLTLTSFPAGAGGVSPGQVAGFPSPIRGPATTFGGGRGSASLWRRSPHPPRMRHSWPWPSGWG